MSFPAPAASRNLQARDRTGATAATQATAVKALDLEPTDFPISCKPLLNKKEGEEREEPEKRGGRVSGFVAKPGGCIYWRSTQFISDHSPPSKTASISSSAKWVQMASSLPTSQVLQKAEVKTYEDSRIILVTVSEGAH